MRELLSLEAQRPRIFEAKASAGPCTPRLPRVLIHKETRSSSTGRHHLRTLQQASQASQADVKQPGKQARVRQSAQALRGMLV